MQTRTLFTLLIIFCSTINFKVSGQTSVEDKDNIAKVKLDSLWTKYSNNFMMAIEKGAILCRSFPGTLTCNDFMFRTRQYLDEDAIELYLGRLDQKTTDKNVLALQYFLNSKKAISGAPFLDFRAQDSKGASLYLSDLARGKDVLLIFGGLGCMGEERLNELKSAYNTMDKSHAEIINYSFAISMDEMQRESENFDVHWPIISDFKGKTGKTKIVYNVQATPTVVRIQKNGKIQSIKEGLDKTDIAFVLGEQ